MTALRDQEPEINIFVGDKKLHSSKRSRAKQDTNGKPSKKQKVKPSPNRKPIPRREAITVKESSERNRQSDVSYRHLFSSTSNLDEKSQKGKNTALGFSFLKEDDETENTDEGKPFTAFPFPLKDESRSDLNETQMQHLRSNAEDDMEIERPPDTIFTPQYPGRRHAGNEHVNGANGRRLTFQGSNRLRDEKLETVRTQASDTLTIPEDIEFRPDEILRLATGFCRKQSVEELEEGWCAPGGIREIMKRDFKQKRQNVTRGRKLGSSNNR